MIESKDKPGFYQSEDGGRTWKHLSSHVGITLDPDVWLRVAQLLADESA